MESAQSEAFPLSVQHDDGPNYFSVSWQSETKEQLQALRHNMTLWWQETWQRRVVHATDFFADRLGPSIARSDTTALVAAVVLGFLLGLVFRNFSRTLLAVILAVHLAMETGSLLLPYLLTSQRELSCNNNSVAPARQTELEICTNLSVWLTWALLCPVKLGWWWMFYALGVFEYVRNLTGQRSLIVYPLTSAAYDQISTRMLKYCGRCPVLLVVSSRMKDIVRRRGPHVETTGGEKKKKHI